MLFKKEKLCPDCKFNDNVTISKTNVKKQYKLTDYDISDPDFHNICYFSFRIQHGCRSSRGLGTRYLIKDIEKLVENLSGCSISDKRYVALTKVQDIRREEHNKLIMIENNKNVAKELLKTMIEKSNQTNLTDQMNFLIDNDFYIDLDYLITEKMDIIEICKKLMIDIEKKARSIYEINKLLKVHYKRQYDKYMKTMRKNSVIYKECIKFCSELFSDNTHNKISIDDQKIKLNKLIDELERDFSSEQKYNRSNKIEKLLKRQNKDICNNEDFYLLIRTNTKYKQYVDESLDSSSQLTLDQLVEKIGKSVRKKIEKNDRKNKLDDQIDQIDQKIDNEYVSAIKNMNIYKNYVNKNEGEIDNVVNELVAEFVKLKQNKQNKQRLVKVKEHDESGTQKIILRLTENGVDVKKLRGIINDFDKSDKDEILLNGYYGNDLQFLNALCKEKGYIYKRKDYDNVLITK